MAEKSKKPYFFYDETYTSKILEKLTNKKFCDVVLISGVDGKRIPVHRVVLSASSKYFLTLFDGAPNINEFTVEEINGKDLVAFVKFCYTGSIQLDTENVKNLLIAATKFYMSNVAKACVKFLSDQYDPKNIIEFCNFAERMKNENLNENIYKIIKQNFMEISKSEAFQKLTSSQLCKIIGSDDLNVPSEETVFEIVMLWINFDAVNRGIFLAGFLSLIRMELLTTEFINTYVRPACDAHGCQKLYIDAIFNRLSVNEPSKMILMKPRNFQQKSSNEPVVAIGWISNQERIDILDYSEETNDWIVRKEISNSQIYGNCLFKNKLMMIVQDRIKFLDIQTGQSELKNFNCNRLNPTCVFFDGCVFVLGGKDDRGRSMEIVEKWNPITKDLMVVASMNRRRVDCGTVVLNGLLYVVGGSNEKESLNAVECYNSKLNKWTNLAPMNSTNSNPWVVTNNRYIYAICYFFFNSVFVERYDPKTNKWTKLNSARVEISVSSCTFLNNRIFVMSRNKYLIYNINEDKWNKINSFRNEYERVLLFPKSQLREID